MDNVRGHKIPIGTFFFQCSLIVKVHPPEREVEGGGDGGSVCSRGARGGILTPQQKVNKFVLNDWSNESWNKGSPAETGSKGVTGSVHSCVLPDILEKHCTGRTRKNSIHCAP